MRKLFISPIENQPISMELLWFWSQSLHTSTLQPLYQKRSFNLGPRLYLISRGMERSPQIFINNLGRSFRIH